MSGELSREQLVEVIFDFGKDYSPETLFLAVEIADRFAEVAGNFYTNNLAHAVLNLSAKIKEDFSDFCTMSSIIDTEGHEVINVEWEVAIGLNFNFCSKNFFDLSSFLLRKEEKILHSCFRDLTKQICLNKQLMKTNPLTLLCGILMLIKKGKLAAKRINRERISLEILEKSAREYGIDFSCLILKFKELI